MLLTEKNNEERTVKGRLVYDGSRTRDWVSWEDAASPTVFMESISLTTVTDAKENRDIMTADIPNAFIQAHMPEIKNEEHCVIMKITGVLVDLLVKLAPDIYSSYVVFENGRKVLYVEVLRALYGMLVAALLWYKTLKRDLEEIGFVFNPYDPCVCNRNVKENQQTVRFHVDDLLSSHVDRSVNDEFHIWLNEKYGG